MRDLDQTEFFTKSIEAACALSGSWQCERPADVKDYLWNILGLRAAACGYHELCADVYNIGNNASEVRHNVGYMQSLSAEANMKADRLCKETHLPFEFSGFHQLLAVTLWHDFRMIYLEVGGMQLTSNLLGRALMSHRQAEQFMHRAYVPDQFRNDEELMGYAYSAADTIRTMLREYSAGRERALIN